MSNRSRPAGDVFGVGHFADADAHPGTFRAVAWSQAYDVPPVVRPEVVTDAAAARPRLDFVRAEVAPAPNERPWYRRASTLLGIVACVILLLAACAVVAFGTDGMGPGPRTVYDAPAPVMVNPPHNP